MNIAFTYNVRHYDVLKNGRKAEEEAEFDSPQTIRDIKKNLESLGHKVFLVEAGKNAYLKFKKLKPKISLVFNYAEGTHGRDREAQIPAMLEMLEIPYTGGSPLSYAIGLNKVKTKEILAYHGILTPKWQVFKIGKEKLEKKLRFPLIVKPQSEGSSKGLFARNLVKNEKQLRKIIREIMYF